MTDLEAACRNAREIDTKEKSQQRLIAYLLGTQGMNVLDIVAVGNHLKNCQELVTPSSQTWAELYAETEALNHGPQSLLAGEQRIAGHRCS